MGGHFDPVFSLKLNNFFREFCWDPCFSVVEFISMHDCLSAKSRCECDFCQTSQRNPLLSEQKLHSHRHFALKQSCIDINSTTEKQGPQQNSRKKLLSSKLKTGSKWPPMAIWGLIVVTVIYEWKCLSIAKYMPFFDSQWTLVWGMNNC